MIGASWINLDPTSHSHLTARIDQVVESLLGATQLERKENIKWLTHWYGSRPFKCRFVHCSRRRTGFEGISDRRMHERHHDRPWKCSFPGCTYAEGGFLSRKMRDTHLDGFHRNQEAKHNIPLPTDSSELLPLLFDLVKSDQVDAVVTLLNLPNGQSHSVSDESKIELCKIACHSGSSDMIDALVVTFFTWSPDPRRDGFLTSYKYYLKSESAKWRLEALKSSILAKNVDTFRLLLSKYTEPYIICYQFFCTVVESDCTEFYDIWETRAAEADFSTTTTGHKTQLADVFLIRRVFIKATASISTREQLLLNHWKRVNISKLDIAYIGDALVNVASTTQSISLAQYLLEEGAPIDHRRNATCLTPLHCAARVDSEQAAEFLKYLLFKGANPETGTGKVQIRDEPGIKGISRWLHLTWDELIAQVKKERAVDLSKGNT